MRGLRVCSDAEWEIAPHGVINVVIIYSDYGDEPKDTFLELPESLGCQFYALETDAFVADIDFFSRLCQPDGRILELGCGTGRIAAGLAGGNRAFTGIDISLAMLQRASLRRHSSCTFICMDMARMAFSTTFDHILITCNTLNLLSSPQKIGACLRGCRRYLQPRGTLVVQIYIPSREFILAGRKTFQFQILDRPGGGKIIKEIIKHYLMPTRTISVEERFRVRPMQSDTSNEDYRRTYSIAGYSAGDWRTIFREAGFTLTDAFSDYHYRPFDEKDSSLLLASFSCSND